MPATATVNTNLDVAIKCQASGEVLNTPPDISQNVKMGQLLVEIDPTDSQRLVDQATSTVALSQSRLEEAQG